MAKKKDERNFMNVLEETKETLRKGRAVGADLADLSTMSVSDFRTAVKGMSGNQIMIAVALARTAMGQGTSKAQFKAILSLVPDCGRSDVTGFWANRRPIKSVKTEITNGLLTATYAG